MLHVLENINEKNPSSEKKKSLNYLLSTIWDIRRESNGCLHTYTAQTRNINRKTRISSLWTRHEREAKKKLGIFVCFLDIGHGHDKNKHRFFLRHSFWLSGENGTAFSRQKWWMMTGEAKAQKLRALMQYIQFEQHSAVYTPQSLLLLRKRET